MIFFPTGIELGSECQETKQQTSSHLSSPTVSQSSPNIKPLKSTAIPEISYSSSEDEDFMSAEEDDDDEEGIATSAEMRTPPGTLDLSSIGRYYFQWGFIVVFSPNIVTCPL